MKAFGGFSRMCSLVSFHIYCTLCGTNTLCCQVCGFYLVHSRTVCLVSHPAFSSEVWINSWLFYYHTLVFLQCACLVLKRVQTGMLRLKRIWFLFFSRIHQGINADVLLKGFDKGISDSMDTQPLFLFYFTQAFLQLFPHFLLLCVTVITFIFEYELKIPLFQFSSFFLN